MTLAQWIVFALALAGPPKPGKIYERVKAAQSCETRKFPDGPVTFCTYNMGSLQFEVTATGGRSPGSFSVYKADWDGEYYLKYGAIHGCIMITWGKSERGAFMSEYAFISLKSGDVSHDWHECENDSRTPPGAPKQ